MFANIKFVSTNVSNEEIESDILHVNTYFNIKIYEIIIGENGVNRFLEYF